ncbi:MAG: VanZ family protein [Gammaproteobacteria bacterium]|nr:VanZ family protein [Gammaproteobacteria bacterium]
MLFRIVFASMILLSMLLSLSSSGHGVPVIWNDKLIHCISYFLLIMMFDFSWESSKQLLIKSVLILVYSGLIEYAQGFVPGRDTSLADIAANAIGVLLFIICVPVLKRTNVYQALRLV